MQSVMALAGQIAANSPGAVEASKAVIDAARRASAGGQTLP